MNPDETTDALRQQIDANVRASAIRNHQVAKGLVDPHALELAREEADPHREDWDEQRAYRESLKQRPMNADDFTDFAEGVQRNFGVVADLLESLTRRVEAVEALEGDKTPHPPKPEKPKGGKAKAATEV